MQIETFIAGAKFRSGAQEIIDDLAESSELEIRPEPDNQYDPNAIKILTDDVHIGYIPGHLAGKVVDLINDNSVDLVLYLGKNKIEIHYNMGLENE